MEGGLPTVPALSQVQSKCVVRGRTELHERVSTKSRNENTEEVRPIGHGRGGKMA